MHRFRLLALSAAALLLVGTITLAQDKQESKKEPPTKPQPGRPIPEEKSPADEKAPKSKNPERSQSKPSSDKSKVSDPKQPSSEDSTEQPRKKIDPLGSEPFIFDSGPFKDLPVFGYDYFAAARENVLAKRTAKPVASKPNDAAKEKDSDQSADKKSKSDPSETGLKKPAKDEDKKSKGTSAGDEDSQSKPDQAPVNALQYFVGPSQMANGNIALPAPDRYQLGPGDKLVVRYSSPLELPKEKTITVDPTGTLVIPVMGTRLTVRGMNLAQAEKAISKEIQRGLRDASVTVSLGELRTISISIVGEVVSQGSYQVPSVMTLFNALYAAGGPTINGSFRNIQLRRSNGTSRNIDLYSYLLKGDPSQDVALQPGDLILVPTATSRVAIKGEVGRPAVYELLAGERVKDLLKYAGGAKSTAILSRTEIKSVNPGVERQLNTVDLTTEANPSLREGDIVTLYALREEIENAIEVEGAVDQPRAYQFRAGMRVSDAITEARGLLKDAYNVRADLYRENPDKTIALVPIDLIKAIQKDPSADLTLQRSDRLRVYFATEVMWLQDRFVKIQGAVRTPGTYLRLDGMHLSDLLLQSGGLLPDASYEAAFVYRKNDDGSEGPLLKPSLTGALLRKPEQDILLKDRDLVVIYRLDDAQFRPKQIVTIQGAVLKGGDFPRSESLTARDLIQLAGGLRPEAADDLQISHSRTFEATSATGTNAATKRPFETYKVLDVLAGRQNPQMQDGDVLTIPGRGDFQEAPILVEVRGRVKFPGVYAITKRGETVADLMAKAGGKADGAWLEGAQFTRSPKNLTSDAEIRLSPRVRALLEEIQEQAYLRALAKSDIDKIRILNAQGGSGVSSMLGALGGVQVPQAGNTSDPEAAKKLLQRETVSAARALSNEELLESGNIPIRLQDVEKSPKSPSNLVLKDGDILTIPEKPTTIAVRGSVILPSALIWEQGKNLDYYLSKCGGATIDADTTQILIIRATGTITKARGSTKLELGDAIFVPTKVMVAKLTDASSTFDSAIKSLTNVGIIWALISRLL